MKARLFGPVAATACAVAVVLAPTGSARPFKGEAHDQFKLNGTAQVAQDPENPTNDVVRIRTDQAPFGGTVARVLDVKIATLDNELEFKSYFVAPRTCNAGIPRITLLVDADGDGDFQQFPASPDFAAHGHVNPPLYTACVPNMWRFDDLTDNLPRWEITPCGAAPPGLTCPFPFNSWDSLETAVTTAFPNHNVCVGFLVDRNEGSPGQTGTAFYDLISLGDETWADRHDGQGRGFPNC